MSEKVIGIDLGSRTTKIVQIENGQIVRSEIFDTGHAPLSRVRESLNKLGSSKIMATGYGRHLVCENFQAQRVTEIKACARGAFHLFPGCRTIIDVGGQDCKVIALNSNGSIADFQMNDRCAAGTGKFLEIMAQTFDMDLDSFVRTALTATSPISISSMCTVFAESEVVSLITSGKPKDRIALGLHKSVANRLFAMLSQLPVGEDIVFVGGGAKNTCLSQLLQDQIKMKLLRPENPQLVVALGAALLAEENLGI